MTGSVFNLDDILGNDKIVDVKDNAGNLKVWNPAEFPADVLNRIDKDYETKNGIRYVIVHFNHPNNPPSNQIGYRYLRDHVE